MTNQEEEQWCWCCDNLVIDGDDDFKIFGDICLSCIFILLDKQKPIHNWCRRKVKYILHTNNENVRPGDHCIKCDRRF